MHYIMHKDVKIYIYFSRYNMRIYVPLHNNMISILQHNSTLILVDHRPYDNSLLAYLADSPHTLILKIE